MQTIALVLIPLPHVPLLTYLTKQSVVVGNLVVVPFRSKEITGIVYEINPPNSFQGELKEISQVLPWVLPKAFLDFLSTAKKYYLADFGLLTKMVLPIELSQKHHSQEQNINPQNFSLAKLSPEQEKVYFDIKNTTKPAVLYGVTGSGKTEVYFHLVADIITSNQQALILLPEIALSQQIIQRFTKAFGCSPAIWHSSITPSVKKKTLNGILSGNIKIIIGTRSALFLPYKNLELIIVDEEHDGSYKQESGIHYNARDMAVLRSHLCQHKVVLGSATPSVETYHNAKLAKYELFKLDTRHNHALLPKISIIDMRKEELSQNHWLCPSMQAKIHQYLEAKQQVLLFLNRRGYAPLMICKSCGYKINCLHCSSSLVWHKSRHRLECHQCGFSAKAVTSCPECKNHDTFIPCGPGIERLQEECQKLFANYRILALSKENMSSAKDAIDAINKITNHEVDIIIGTQIITKGYHFAKLNFVGIVDADVGFSNWDLRSVESTFQLLQQVSGRAGRESFGEVALQSYQYNSKTLSYIVNNEYEQFIENEIQNREASLMPPFTKLALLTFKGANQIKTLATAKSFTTQATHQKGINIMGPAPAVINRLRGQYHYNVLIVCNKGSSLQQYLSKNIRQLKIPSSIKLGTDIDPYTLA